MQETRIVQIKQFSKEGQGQGTCFSPQGHSYLVDIPFSAPGDEVEVQLLKRKRGVYQSRPLNWLHLAESRVKPHCRHFGYCGGCRWQHVAYEEQLKQKEMWVYKAFEPYLHSDTTWHAIIPCQPPWQYRNKMELSFSKDKAGNRYLGLILYKTRGLFFQMQECHLIHEWVVHAVQAVSAWWEECGLDAYHMRNDQGTLRTLTLREGQRTGDRMVMLTVSGNPHYALSQNQLQQFVSALRHAIEPQSRKLSIFLRIQQIAKGKPTQFYEMLLYGPDHIEEVLHIESVGALQFRISPTAFFQPNTRQAEQLYSRVIQLTSIPKDALVYDLYCGTGTLGICVAKQVKEVIGVELSPESALDARENVKMNHLSHVTIHTGDVGQLLPNLLKDGQRPDVVLVDPPRAGLDPKALKHLLEIKAPGITYISCNPVTQAANLEILIKGGYRLKAVQPIDQFPQTVHVENIAALTL